MHKINKALSELWLSDEQCDVCARLRQIQRHENPNFVAELSTGYVVLGDDQHWHLFPRHANDTPVPGPVWRTPKEVLHGPQAQITPAQRQAWIMQLRQEIERLLRERE